MNDKEIKVGEYVRTKNGKIIKCTGFGTFRKEGQSNRVKTIISGHSHYIYDYIVKHSSNIIDLIEAGDYVNGDKIISISEDPFIKGQINLWTERHEVNSFGDTERIKYFYRKNDIISIVTKEQFKNIEYKVGE